MLNTININLKTDIKKDRPTSLPIKLMSQDKNNNQFILRFTSGGESVTLDDTYTVEVLTKFTKSGTSRLTTAKVRQDYATWEFDTAYIAHDETVYNYVYVRKSGILVVSADSNAFYFEVGLSEIDKDAGRVAETYDENYEKVLLDYSGTLDDRTTERLDEAVDDFNQRGDAEISDWREYADVELEDYLADKVALKNVITNGDFSNGTTGWVNNGGETLSVFDNQINRYVLEVIGLPSSYPGVRRTIQSTVGNKMYTSFLGKVATGDPTGTKRPYVGFGVSSGLYFDSKEYTRHSFIQTSNSDLFFVLGGNTAGVDTTVRFADIVAIDLTQTFGAGNEPSKEWMDKLVEETGYFDEHILDENWQVGELLRLNNTKANKVQEDWITPTLLNGWENTAGTTPIGYYKDTLEVVRFRGSLKSGVDNTEAFVLPVGYRPLTTVRSVAMSSDSGVGRYDISPSGIVRPHKGSGTYAYAVNVTFRAEG